MLQDVIKDLILDHIGPLKRSSNDWNTRNCPMCHTQGESRDTRGRFGIRFPPSGDIAVACFNCGFKTSHTESRMFGKKFILFLKEIGIPDQTISKINFELYRAVNKVAPTKAVIEAESITKSWDTIELPKDAHPLRMWLEHGCNAPAFLKVIKYLKGRSLYHVDAFYWSPDKDWMMNRRVIIPCWYEGRIVGYSARFVGNDKVSSVPKYTSSVPKGYVYNLDPQLTGERKFVILAEGELDAFNVDGISVMGNLVTSDQLSVIRRVPGQKIVIPDQDNPGNKLIDAALEEGWWVSFPKWPTGIKDVSKSVEIYGRIATTKMILDAAEDDPVGVKVKYELRKPPAPVKTRKFKRR